MQITKEDLFYRFTVASWFVLGLVVGALGMRVIDMWNYLDTTQDPHYLCQKGIAYQSMGDGHEIIYVKTNLQCLGD